MQKSISFSKGITTSPSDILSSDDELAESVGMLFRQGEMHPVQNAPKIASVSGETIVFVHKVMQHTAFVTDSGGGTVSIYGYANGKLTLLLSVAITNSLLSVGAVGSTLILSTADGMQYVRYANGQYTYLGSQLPVPSVSFWLGAAKAYTDDSSYSPPTLTDYVVSDTCRAYYSSDRDLLSIEQVIVNRGGNTAVKETVRITDGTPDDSKTLTYRGYGVIADKQTDFNDAVQGIVAHNIELAKKDRAFSFPFFVRYALRLYDGTYARISNPILCLPSIHCNGALISRALYQRFRYDSSFPVGFGITTQKAGYFEPLLHSAALYFRCSIPDIDKWKDIVKDFVVFASDETMPFAIDGGWTFCNPAALRSSLIALDGIKSDRYFNSAREWTYKAYEGSTWGTGGPTISTRGPLTSLIVPKKFYTDEQLKTQLLQNAVFYKLFDIKATSTLLDGATDNNSQDFIEEGGVVNLTEQQRLDADDYYGWATMAAENMFTYNSRLNLTGVTRSPFCGFSQFVAVLPGTSNSAEYLFYTHVVTAGMDTWVKAAVSTIPQALGAWFAYPDTNAKELRIVNSSQQVASLTLQQHPRLNAAYAMGALGAVPAFGSGEVPTVGSGAETLSSQIFTSVVGNPFVFQASGDNTVGTGSILGVGANTEPISQGQFGQYPLIVFTTDGIYGMAVSSEGLYSSSYPMSREVCNNAKSITPTGSLVFFTSAKGLMAVSGGSVSCVSEQLQPASGSQFALSAGGSFADFCAGALLAYDYRDSLLHILNPTSPYGFVYSMGDGTFAKVQLADRPLAVAAAYPDALIQLQRGDILSLTDKPDASRDSAAYSARFTTRPLKLGSSIQLKTIHRIIHLLSSSTASLALSVYASNDCKHWCRLHSLHGKPWKYYTFSYALDNMRAADTFAGSVVDFQTLLPDKIR